MPPGDVLHPAKIIIPLSSLFVFPQQLFNCQALKKLSMPDNDLSNLPTTIASLVNLKELDISKNGIQPKQPWFKITGRNLIIAIPKLHNEEEEETKPGGPDFCETKHHVWLSSCQTGIQEFPDNIKCCKGLSVVEASVNPITK